MSAALLNRDDEDNVYGAVTFRQADPTTGDFDYTVHVSQLHRNVRNSVYRWFLSGR